jgi:hypothetical protein
LEECVVAGYSIAEVLAAASVAVEVRFGEAAFASFLFGIASRQSPLILLVDD